VQVESAPGVRASARTYHAAVYVIVVNAGTKAATVHLTVPDTGVRIPPELLARIFPAFEQAANSSTRPFAGP
jgi:signal transduction histidine kinase